MTGNLDIELKIGAMSELADRTGGTGMKYHFGQ
jgi:hypothetical protein